MRLAGKLRTQVSIMFAARFVSEPHSSLRSLAGHSHWRWPRFGALSMVRMPVLSGALAMATDNPFTQAALSGDLGATVPIVGFD